MLIQFVIVSLFYTGIYYLVNLFMVKFIPLFAEDESGVSMQNVVPGILFAFIDMAVWSKQRIRPKYMKNAFPYLFAAFLGVGVFHTIALILVKAAGLTFLDNPMYISSGLLGGLLFAPFVKRIDYN